MGPFSNVGVIFALGAAILHVVVFYLESFAWTSDGALKAFNMTKEEAEILKKWLLIRDFTIFFLPLRYSLASS